MTAALITVGGVLVAVAIHELGHLIVARLFKLDVECYFVGFGPKLWSMTTKSDIEVGFRALPIGGYVKIPGMDLRKADEFPEGTFAHAPWWQQVGVAAAGPITHFGIAFVLFLAALTIFMPTGDPAGRPTVSGVEMGTLSYEAGLRSGDVIVEINGEAPADWQAASAHFGGEADTVIVERGGETLTLEGMEWDGTYMAEATQAMSFGEATVAAAETTVNMVPALTTALVDTFARTPEITRSVIEGGDVPMDRAMSLVGLATASDDLQGSYGWFGILMILGQLNVFFAMLNLLPIYPFDGGHIAGAILARLTQAWPKTRLRILTGLNFAAYGAVGALVLLFLATFTVDIIDIIR